MLTLNCLSCGSSGSEPRNPTPTNPRGLGNSNPVRPSEARNQAPPQPSGPQGPSGPNFIVNLFDKSVDIKEFIGKVDIVHKKDLSGLNIASTAGRIVPYFGEYEKRRPFNGDTKNGFGIFSNFYNSVADAGYPDSGHPAIPWESEMEEAYKNCGGITPITSKDIPPIKCVENYFQLYKCLQTPKMQGPFLQKSYETPGSMNWGRDSNLLNAVKNEIKSLEDCIKAFIKLSADESRKVAECLTQLQAAGPEEFIKRDQVIFKALLKKFPQSHPYTATLLSTGNAILIEGNQWKEDRFGVTYNATTRRFNKNAENKLGNMLMLIRYIRSKAMEDDDPFVQDAISNRVWRLRKLCELLDPSRLF